MYFYITLGVLLQFLLSPLSFIHDLHPSPLFFINDPCPLENSALSLSPSESSRTNLPLHLTEQKITPLNAKLFPKFHPAQAEDTLRDPRGDPPCYPSFYPIDPLRATSTEVSGSEANTHRRIWVAVHPPTNNFGESDHYRTATTRHRMLEVHCGGRGKSR